MTPPDGRQPQTRAQQTRARLIAAASQGLIAGQGSFEIADIARRARVSVGLAYHCFGSKAGLVSAVVNSFYDGIAHVINLADSTEFDWELRERERLSRLITFLFTEELAPILISKLSRDPEVAAVESARWSELIDAAARNITKAQRRGQVACTHDPRVLAALISGGIRHAVGQALAALPRPSQDDLTADIWGFIARGIQLSPVESRSGAARRPPAARARRRH